MEFGVTVTDPLAPNVPTPAMLTEVALLVDQFRTADPPIGMLSGCAPKLIVGVGGGLGGVGPGDEVTLITADDWLCPPGPVAVTV